MPRLLLSILLTLPLALHAAPRTCLIVGVTDGDTLKARCGAPGHYEALRVRLRGIDAPETRQPFGTRAKVAMSELVYMKDADLDCPRLDRYGRSVCRVKVAPRSAPGGPRTLDAGLALVTAGLAWWYRDYAREQTPQERGQYAFAEQEVRARRAGLWRDPDAVPPWEWRKARRGR